jgi:membrane protein YdbS with pleckstrin-like domain
MMSAFVGLLKPLLMPLLKLKTEPPHLPEGVALVRHLKPADAWLGLRYANVLLQAVPQLAGLSVALLVVTAARSATKEVPPGVGALLAVVLGLSAIGLLIALATARIDFELRHYLVGDRSLRVSHGAWTRREVTLSYANVQNLEVLQGPLERIFGIKSLMVSTAGGEQVAGRPSSHQVVLAGIADADAVRALILDMVKQQRDQGLGEATAAQGHGGGLEAKLLEEVRDAAVALKEAAHGRFSTAPSSTT